MYRTKAELEIGLYLNGIYQIIHQICYLFWLYKYKSYIGVNFHRVWWNWNNPCGAWHYPVPQATSSTFRTPCSFSKDTTQLLYSCVLLCVSPMYSCHTFAALPSAYWSGRPSAATPSERVLNTLSTDMLLLLLLQSASVFSWLECMKPVCLYNENSLTHASQKIRLLLFIWAAKGGQTLTQWHPARH